MQWMHPHRVHRRQSLPELLTGAEPRVGPGLRVAAVDAAHVPPENLECGDAVLLRLACQPGQVLESMNNDILRVGDDHRLPRHFLTEPCGRTPYPEVFVEP